ncbi:hypothetical protein [Mesorhizobium japonicum]|uniref:hypothetical protein n=1 Tax=Mesorhizobium japonicum TaxID=2066070 RepID=UPI003B5BA1C3
MAVVDRAQVLITVKAAPEPSKTYIDTVCVAGIRLDGDAPSWIRLYPVPFRHLAGKNKFQKFHVIDVDVNLPRNDNRSESRRPVWESMTPQGDPLSTRGRLPILEPMVTKTMCELEDDVVADQRSQSLGLIRVAELDRLDVSPHPGWNDEQKRIMADQLSQPDLFGEVDRSPMIEAPRFIVHYRYRCTAVACRGHGGRILDWELAALQYRLRRRSDEEMRRMIEQKFVTEKFRSGLAAHLFVGNYAHPTKRRHFSALGVWSPAEAQMRSQTLW